MANNSVTRRFVAGAPRRVTAVTRLLAPVFSPVIPALQAVIPAKAGIQSHAAQRPSSTTVLDTRLRGYDGVQWVDLAEAGRVGV